MRAVIFAICSFCVAAPATNADAAEGDGAFGRIEGDVTLVGALEGGIVADSKRKLAGIEARARYLQAAGIFLGYEEADALGPSTDRGVVHRSFLGGFEFRPLFPVRFFRNDEQGPAFGNLVLDSIGIDFGPIFSMREGMSTSRAGLLAGLGVEVPIVGRASGPWIRLAASLRWSPQRLDGDVDANGRVVVFSLALAWHQVIATHVVDAADEAPK